MYVSSNTYKFLFEQIVNKLKNGKYSVKDRKIWKNLPESELLLFYSLDDIKEEKEQKKQKIKVQDGYRYYLYGLYKKKFSLLYIDDEVLRKALLFLKEKNSDNNVVDTANSLLKSFENNNKEILSQRLKETIPNKFLSIVEYLTENRWWFCFRGHPREIGDIDDEAIEDTNHVDGWWFVYNKLEFNLETPGLVAVSKLGSGKPVAARYRNLFGSIDFSVSNSDTLVINVYSKVDLNKDSPREHCHIKITGIRNYDSQLYLSQFLSFESDGHLSSGTAILLKVDDAIKEFYAGEYWLTNHYSINDAKPIFSEKLPHHFWEIAFYFQNKGQNMMRTTRETIYDAKKLRAWKRTKEKKKTLQDAKGHLQEGIEILERAISPDHPSLIKLRAELTSIEQDLGLL